MIILHYTLGLTPQRSGGLTKYATDLMCEQQKTHNVVLLFPCGYSPLSKKISCKQGKDFNGIKTFKLKNTYPIPLLYGILEPQHFFNCRKMSVEQMEELYNNIKPDVFHVHTLMGLPKELLIFFKEKGVRLIYTTHDYFGLGTNANWVDGGSAELYKVQYKSTLYMRLRNSQFALNFKNSQLLKKLLRR